MNDRAGAAEDILWFLEENPHLGAIVDQLIDAVGVERAAEITALELRAPGVGVAVLAERLADHLLIKETT